MGRRWQVKSAHWAADETKIGAFRYKNRELRRGGLASFSDTSYICLDFTFSSQKKVYMKRLLLLMIAALSIGACNTTKKTIGDQFGESITAKGAIPYEQLLTKMESVDSMAVKVSGDVSAVCQMKGCWLTMTANDPGRPEMMVKFKDYGFFVPKDISGRKVVLDGYAFRKVTSVEELRHYAEDAGKSKEEIEAITEPSEALQFLASGVILLPE